MTGPLSLAQTCRAQRCSLRAGCPRRTQLSPSFRDLLPRPLRRLRLEGRRPCQGTLAPPPPPPPAPPVPSAPEVLEVLELEALAEIQLCGEQQHSSPSALEALDVIELEVEEALARAPPTGPLLVLTCDDGQGGRATFYVLGTAHASEASCRDAASLIRVVQPEVVMVELCRERAAMLGREKSEEVTLGQVLAAIGSGRLPAFAGIYGWLLSKLGRDMGVVPGAEFTAAMRAAKAAGVMVALGDRPISITVARTWHALTLWEKAKLLASLLFTGMAPTRPQTLKAEIERMKETSVTAKAMEEFAKDFPSIVRPLLTERDEYMVYIMRRKLAPRWKTVVAVVGAGHLQGIRDKWEAEIDFDEIMRMPDQRPGRKGGTTKEEEH